MPVVSPNMVVSSTTSASEIAPVALPPGGLTGCPGPVDISNGITLYIGSAGDNTTLLSGYSFLISYVTSNGQTLYLTQRGTPYNQVTFETSYASQTYFQQQYWTLNLVNGNSGSIVYENQIFTLTNVSSGKYLEFNPSLSCTSGNLDATSNGTTVTAGTQFSFLLSSNATPYCCSGIVTSGICPLQLSSTCNEKMINYCTPSLLLAEGNSTTGSTPCISYCKNLSQSNANNYCNLDFCSIPANQSNPVCGCNLPDSSYPALAALKESSSGYTISRNCIVPCGGNPKAVQRPINVDVSSCSENIVVCINNEDIYKSEIEGKVTVDVTNTCGTSPSPSFISHYWWILLIIGVVFILLIIVLILIVISRK